MRFGRGRADAGRAVCLAEYLGCGRRPCLGSRRWWRNSPPRRRALVVDARIHAYARARRRRRSAALARRAHRRHARGRRANVQITDAPLSAMPWIYKIVPGALWREAERDGVFRGSPVDLADGYIHFSTAAQVQETAAKHFAGHA